MALLWMVNVMFKGKLNTKLIPLIAIFLIPSTSLFASTNTGNPSIFIFVSFSMPKESLRGWLREADKIKAPIIIRGLVKNSFRETIKTVYEILPDKRGGIQLDPTLFKKFKIDKVPAVLVAESSCITKPICQSYHVIYGDVTLSYALKELSKTNDVISKQAEIALKQLSRDT